MRFSLGRSAEAAGYRLRSYVTVGSTSAEALARAASGEAGPLWIVSAEQTAGRGRRGNGWQTPRGNLAASLLLTLDLPPATIAQLGFVAGLALVEALDGLVSTDARWAASRSTRDGSASFEAPLRGAPQDEDRRGNHPAPRAEMAAGGGPRSTRDGEASSETSASRDRRDTAGGETFRLKWPNDVLADDGKIAGILVQTEQDAGGHRHAVVGIGVNVVAAPAGVAYPATSLATLGAPATADEVFVRLSDRWVDWYARWDGGRGFPAVREGWLTRAAGLGGPVAVAAGAAAVRGTFETLDEAGHLVVRRADGTSRAVSAGEVHFGDAASLREEAAA